MNKHPAHTPHCSLFPRNGIPRRKYAILAHIAHISVAQPFAPFRRPGVAFQVREKGSSASQERLFRTTESPLPHIRRHRLAPQESPFRTVPPVFPSATAHLPLRKSPFRILRNTASGLPAFYFRISGCQNFYFHTAYLFISPRRPTQPATAIRQPPSPRLTAVTQPAGCTAVKRHASHRHLTTYPDVYTPTLLTTVRQFITFASHSGKIPCGGHSFTQYNAAGRNDGIPSYRLTRLVLRKETVMRRRPHTRCSTRRAPSHSRHGSRTPRPGTLKV